jgi:hypothetical protein
LSGQPKSIERVLEESIHLNDCPSSAKIDTARKRILKPSILNEEIRVRNGIALALEQKYPRGLAIGIPQSEAEVVTIPGGLLLLSTLKKDFDRGASLQKGNARVVLWGLRSARRPAVAAKHCNG